MKTTILADGTLSVTPESDLEAFALHCWSQQNICNDWYDVTRRSPKIIIDLTEYADRMGLIVTVPGNV